MDWDLPLGSASSGDSFQHLLAQVRAARPSTPERSAAMPRGLY
jgi:hypothetical protein